MNRCDVSCGSADRSDERVTAGKFLFINADRANAEQALVPAAVGHVTRVLCGSSEEICIDPTTRSPPAAGRFSGSRQTSSYFSGRAKRGPVQVSGRGIVGRPVVQALGLPLIRAASHFFTKWRVLALLAGERVPADRRGRPEGLHYRLQTLVLEHSGSMRQASDEGSGQARDGKWRAVDLRGRNPTPAYPYGAGISRRTRKRLATLGARLPVKRKELKWRAFRSA